MADSLAPRLCSAVTCWALIDRHSPRNPRISKLRSHSSRRNSGNCCKRLSARASKGMRRLSVMLMDISEHDFISNYVWRVTQVIQIRHTESNRAQRRKRVTTQNIPGHIAHTLPRFLCPLGALQNCASIHVAKAVILGKRKHTTQPAATAFELLLKCLRDLDTQMT